MKTINNSNQWSVEEIAMELAQNPPLRDFMESALKLSSDNLKKLINIVEEMKNNPDATRRKISNFLKEESNQNAN